MTKAVGWTLGIVFLVAVLLLGVTQFEWDFSEMSKGSFAVIIPFLAGFLAGK